MIKYLSFSIGPIFHTLKNTRSTKALWASSYLFSWIMREVMKALQGDIKSGRIEMLNVFQDKPEVFQDLQRVGLFPDRFVARVNKEPAPDLKTIAESVIDELAEMFTDDLNNITLFPEYVRKAKGNKSSRIEKKEVSEFLRQYFRLIALEMELPEDDPNPVKSIDNYLNSLELTAPRPPEEKVDMLGTFFEDLHYNGLIRAGFGTDGFPSTPEVATAFFSISMGKDYEPFRKKLKDPGILEALRQQRFMEALGKEAGKAFKLCHKYVAIVRADGDNMGKLFQLRNDDGRRLLANCLADFSLAAAKAIRLYGGIAVYAGGDDLLFIAPAVSLIRTEKGLKTDHIFDLLGRLDGLFDEHVLKNAKITKEETEQLAILIKSPSMSNGVSMSYGVSVSYYKYPMGESLEVAQTNLFSKIKQVDRRNGIAWNLTKHSGADFGVTFQKHRLVFPVFKKLLEVKPPEPADPGAFLSSVIFKLEDLEGSFHSTAASKNRAEHFHSILFNNFNEKIHRDNKDVNELSPYLRKVLELILAVFEENPVTNKTNAQLKKQIIKDNLFTAYSCLRFIHFLNSPAKS